MDMDRIDALIAAALGNKQVVYKPPLPSAPPTQTMPAPPPPAPVGYAGGTSNVPGPNTGSDSYDSYRRALQQQDPNSASNVVANMRAKLTGVDTQRPSPPQVPIPGYAWGTSSVDPGTGQSVQNNPIQGGGVTPPPGILNGLEDYASANKTMAGGTVFTGFASGTSDVQPPQGPLGILAGAYGDLGRQVAGAAQAGNWLNYGIPAPPKADQAPAVAPVAAPAPAPSDAGSGNAPKPAAKAAPQAVDPYANLRAMAAGMTTGQFLRFMSAAPHPQTALDQIQGNAHQLMLNNYAQDLQEAQNGQSAEERNAAQAKAGTTLYKGLEQLNDAMKFTRQSNALGDMYSNMFGGGAGAVDPASRPAGK